MLGKIKLLENNVRDLYSICHDEFGTNMTSQCYESYQNLAEFIQTLKQDVLFSFLNKPSDKTALSKIYDKLCSLESELIDLIKKAKPIEQRRDPKERDPKTVRTCNICQRRTVHQDNDGKKPHYLLPSRSRQMENNEYDWLRDNVERFYERLSFVDLKNVPSTRKVYQYPSIEYLPSSPSSSISTVSLDEYYVVPNKINKNYRIVRERLPFSVEKSNNHSVTKKRRNSPKLRQPRNMPETSVREYEPRDFARSYEYNHKPRRRKKKKRNNKGLRHGGEIYFVTKTKNHIHSGFNNKSPNDKYIVSRLRRIPTPANFNNGESRLNTVKSMHRGRKHSDGQRRSLPNRNSSQTSMESEFIRAKWRRSPESGLTRRPMRNHPSFPQNSISSDSSNINGKPFNFQSSSSDDYSSEYNTQGQSQGNLIQTNRSGARKLRDNNFETKTCIFNERPIINSNYEVVDSFYGPSLNPWRFKTTQNNAKTLPIPGHHVRSNNLISNTYEGIINKRDIPHPFIEDQKSCSFSKTPMAHSLYVKQAPLYESSVGGAPPHRNKKNSVMIANLSSPSLFSDGITTRVPRKIQLLRGQNRGPRNRVSVYQIHGETRSNPFLKYGTNKKSSLAPLKESSSLLKPRKSPIQKPMQHEAIVDNIVYSYIKNSGDVSDALGSTRKSSAAASLVRKSKTKLSKVGGKIKNLARSVSKLKLKKQDTKNSVIDRSESLPSFKPSDPNAKVESIYKQPSHKEVSNKPKSGLLGNGGLSGTMPARPFAPAHVDGANQRRLSNSIDNNKPNVKQLTYSLRYDKETRHDFECNGWPSISSLNHLGSNCKTLLSEEKIDFSEHKLNGLKTHNKLHTFHTAPSTTKEANNNRKLSVRSPKRTDLRPNSLDYEDFVNKYTANSYIRNVPIAKSSSVPQLCSDSSSHIDWKQIVNEIKES